MMTVKSGLLIFAVHANNSLLSNINFSMIFISVYRSGHSLVIHIRRDSQWLRLQKFFNDNEPKIYHINMTYSATAFNGDFLSKIK